MLVAQVRTEIHVDYAQYYLRDADAEGGMTYVGTDGTGLIGVDDDRAFLVSGEHTGTIPVVVEVHDIEPEHDLDKWDDVVDTAMDFLSGRVCVDEWGGGRPVSLGLPETDDTYLIRVCVRGRDGDRPELHRIAIWPAFMIDAPIIWRARDAKGAYFRHADARRGPQTVDFRDPTPRVFVQYDHCFPRDDLTGVVHRMSVPVYAADRVAIEFVGYTSYPTGCMLRLDSTVTSDDLDDPDWRRRTDTCRAGFAAGLRVTFAIDGDPPATSALRPEEPAEPTGPSLTGYVYGAHVGSDRVVGQHQAWRWPRPAAGVWRMTVEWPELGVPPTPFTVEAAG